MPYSLSDSDRTFRTAFESGVLNPAEFGHRSHVQLAYIYLTENDLEDAYSAFKMSILGFLAHHEIDSGKYHETLTKAWILAVRHFMNMTPEATSADEFIDQNPVLLDSSIMLTHYSMDRLFSDEARGAFIQPDLDPIPTMT